MYNYDSLRPVMFQARDNSGVTLFLNLLKVCSLDKKVPSEKG